MRARSVVFAPEARQDLLRIYDTVADTASPLVAIAYVERLEAHCNRFDLASERGQRRDDIRPGLRITGFERRVTIASAVADTEVTILRLFYGGQDWERKMR